LLDAGKRRDGLVVYKVRRRVHVSRIVSCACESHCMHVRRIVLHRQGTPKEAALGECRMVMMHGR